MIEFKINQAKTFFFDRPVVAAVDKAARANLSKFGAFVRRTAKGLIRKSKKPSAPGQPPKSHTGLLRDFLFFAFDPGARTVVIGPARLNKPGLAPQTLEHGGRATVYRRVKGQRKPATVHIAPRPYMAPALAKEAPKFASLWADTVKGN